MLLVQEAAKETLTVNVLLNHLDNECHVFIAYDADLAYAYHLDNECHVSLLMMQIWHMHTIHKPMNVKKKQETDHY